MCGKIVIYGCGGHARSVLSAIEEYKHVQDIIFVDDNARPNEQINGYKVFAEYDLKPNDCYHVAIGNNSKRKQVYEDIKQKNIGQPLSVISKYATVRPNAQIGEGVFVSALAYIGAKAVVGDNTIINTSAIIEHDTKIGCHCHIAPKSVVCGKSQIDDLVMLGVGTNVIDNVHIGENITVGAGATVVKDIKKTGTYIGTPAKLL